MLSLIFYDCMCRVFYILHDGIFLLPHCIENMRRHYCTATVFVIRWGIETDIFSDEVYCYKKYASIRSLSTNILLMLAVR